MSARLLLVEDETSLAVGLVDVLKVKGYHIDHADNGEEGLAMALEGDYALLLLDAMLPGLSGFDLLRQLRQKKKAMPVIMLTARSTEMDRVLGFELGVDDYVTKPFSLLELLGRIAAVLRRTGAQAEAPATPAAPAITSQAVLKFGDVLVDLDRFTVTKGDTDLPLPARGFEILKAMAARRGQVVGRETLMDDVWGVDECITLRTLNNLMVKIRGAIEVNPEDPRYLKTIHGVGYRLDM